jgi:hypothetical protein
MTAAAWSLVVAAWVALVAVITLDAAARGVALDLVILGAVGLLTLPAVLLIAAQAAHDAEGYR